MTSPSPITVKQVESALRGASTTAKAILVSMFPHASLHDWSCSWNVR
jgi:hypothetical protein